MTGAAAMNTTRSFATFILLFAGCAFFSGFAVPGYGLDDESLKPGRKVDLSEAGLSFRAFRGVTRLPPPALAVSMLTPKGKRVAAVSIRSYWQREQTVAFLAGSDLSLTVYRPSCPVPETLPVLEKDLQRESVISEWMSRQKTPDLHDPNQRAKWLKYLFRRDVREAPDFLYAGADPDGWHVYVMSRPPDRERGTAWLVFSVRTPPDSRGEKKLIRALKTLAGTVQISAPGKTLPGAVPKKGEAEEPGGAPKSDPDAASEERERSLRAAVGSIQSLKDWWHQETEHFVILSNVRKRKELKSIAEEAEQMRSFCEKILPPFERIGQVSVIRVFADPGQYRSYIGEKTTSSVGVWLMNKQELVLNISGEILKDRRARNDIFRQILHRELFKQYLFYALNKTASSPWFDIGFAGFFGCVEFKPGDRKAYCRMERNLENSAAAILKDRSVEFRKIRSMRYPEFLENSKTTYVVSLAAIYYMLKGAPLRKETSHYAQIPFRFYDALRKTRRIEDAEAAAWKGIDPVRFDRDLRSFWGGKDLKKSQEDASLVLPPAASDKP